MEENLTGNVFDDIFRGDADTKTRDEYAKLIGDIETKLNESGDGKASLLLGTVVAVLPDSYPLSAKVSLNTPVAGVKTGSQIVSVPLLLTNGGGMETHSLVSPGATVLILAQGDYKVAIAVIPTAVWGPKATLAASYAIGLDVLNPLNYIQCMPGGILTINIPPTVITISPMGVNIVAPTITITSNAALQFSASASLAVTAPTIAVNGTSLTVASTTMNVNATTKNEMTTSDTNVSSTKTIQSSLTNM